MITVDTLQVYLPQYLSEFDQQKLVEHLKQFTDNPLNPSFFGFVDSSLKDSLLQGDALLKGLLEFHSNDEKRKDAPGMILSNTCDISLGNTRPFPLNMAYAPIFNLEKYEKLLEEKKGQGYAESVIASIRKQHTTTYFYLPANSGLGYEGFVHFDKITNSKNNDAFYTSCLKNRIFSLSQFDHYLLLFKLSIHFTRLQEGITRHDKV